MSDPVKDKEKKGGKLAADGTRDEEDTGQRTITLENTYQLGPLKRFPVAAVTHILTDVLTSHLQEEKYELQRSREQTLTLCKIIKSRVKELLIPRYKIVVLVHIGQLTGQSIQISSRCLWDASNDNFASYSFKNSSLFCVATVYVVYFE
ncbi:dynein light chain Tctex-type 5-A-like isoform 1-T2 [Menidia menidia]|uniref:(Atlantic silverside) hypothetical protein n=1 Tax=Menidia menidia TaxID=238744 RepID=A0A8S4AYD0_9TELE|nr:unnamed protein product [Menidia menidia]